MLLTLQIAVGIWLGAGMIAVSIAVGCATAKWWKKNRHAIMDYVRWVEQRQ